MWVPPGDYCENEYKRSSGVSQLEALAAIKRLQQTLVAGSITTTTIEAGSIKAAKLAGAVQPIGSLYHDRDGGALYRKTGKDTWTRAVPTAIPAARTVRGGFGQTYILKSRRMNENHSKLGKSSNRRSSTADPEADYWRSNTFR